MSSSAELATAPKESEAQRQDNALATPAQELASEQDGGLLSRAFGGAPGEPPADGAVRFLSSTLSHSANSGLRAVSLKRAQQTFGNRFAQRAVAQVQRKSAAARFLQRQCSCGGTCASCQGKLVDVSMMHGSLWMMATASDALDPAAIASETLAQRLEARQIDSLKHYAPALHAGLFSASSLARDKLSRFLKPLC